MTKEIAIVAITSFVNILTSILLVKTLSMYLNIEEYGLYSLFLSFVGFVNMVPFTAMNNGVSKYSFIYNAQNKLIEFYQIIILFYLILLILYILLVTGLNTVISFRKFEYFINILILFTISEVIYSLVISFENSLRNRIFILFATIFAFLIKIGSILLFKNNLNLLYNIFIFFTLSNFFVIIFSFYKRKIYKMNTCSMVEVKKIIKKIINFSYPFIIWGIFGWFYLLSNRLYIDLLLSTTEVGIYSMMLALGQFIPVAVTGFMTSLLLPIVYEKELKSFGFAKEVLLKGSTFLFILFLFIGIFFVFFSKDIIILISDKKYLEFSWMLPIFFIVSAISSIVIFATVEISAYKENKILILSNILPSLWFIFFGYFMIKYFGFNGALYNFIIGNIILIIMNTYKIIYFYKTNKEGSRLVG